MKLPGKRFILCSQSVDLIPDLDTLRHLKKNKEF